MYIYRREGAYKNGHQWRHYVAIADAVVYLVEMRRALFGWNFHSLETQDDWDNMSAERIIAWKAELPDECRHEIPKAEHNQVEQWITDTLTKHQTQEPV